MTVDDIKAAYVKTGLRPVRKVWGSKAAGCGCPLTALYCAAHPTIEYIPSPSGFGMRDRYAVVARELGLSSDFAEGLADGWDGLSNVNCSVEFTAGYSLGKAAQEVILP